MPIDQRLSAITSHTAEYFQQWCTWRTWRTRYTSYDRREQKYTTGLPDATARVLLAAGHGPARLPSCQHALRHGSMEYKTGTTRKLDARALLRRALSLFGGGELRTLCVAGPDVMDFVVSLLQSESETAPVSDAGTALSRSGLKTEAPPPLAGRALDGLCAVAWPYQPKQLDAAFALIVRHAATITALDCHKWSKSDAAERALARCTRLQSLSFADCYVPASWLQCTQLHTLRGVDFAAVSVSNIAAALPRLHTLATVITRAVPGGALAEFFEDLLPRLRVFHFEGTWPSNPEDATRIVAQPLPLLQELVWRSSSSCHAEARGLAGAQPVTLDTSHAMVADWFALPGGGGRPLARVRDLRVSGSGSTDTSGVARMLRAAPHLRKIAILGSHGIPFWYTLAEPSTRAFTVTHELVRSIAILIDTHHGPSADAVSQLREEQHFPCLRELIVYVPNSCSTCSRLSYQSECPANCGGWWCPNTACRARCSPSATHCSGCNSTRFDDQGE